MKCLANYNIILLVYPAIVIPPTPVNISLNEVAVLNCTAITTHIHWQVNGEPVDETWERKGIDGTASLRILNETQSLCMKSLTVVGSNYTNNINVVCAATILTTVYSEPVQILVQGDYSQRG